MTILIQRIYDQDTDDTSYRVLVDRLWPRGISKDKAQLDLWLRDVAPSDDLRKWFGHDPTKFDEFAARYRRELAGNTALDDLQHIVRTEPKVTLVYSARDEVHNQAVVLRQILLEHLGNVS